MRLFQWAHVVSAPHIPRTLSSLYRLHALLIKYIFRYGLIVFWLGWNLCHSIRSVATIVSNLNCCIKCNVYKYIRKLRPKEIIIHYSSKLNLSMDVVWSTASWCVFEHYLKKMDEKLFSIRQPATVRTPIRYYWCCQQSMAPHVL